MPKKKNSFRKQWRTLTEIGDVFGVSARKLGSLLKQHGLREDDGSPSSVAQKEEYCHLVQPKDGKSYWLWHGDKVTAYLEAKGIEKAGVSATEASLNTEARMLARSYIEAVKLDEEGNKMGYWLFDDLKPHIKKLGLLRFNQALKDVGFQGDLLKQEDIDG